MNSMKKVGIITLTRQNSLAYSTLRRIVNELGYKPICGETIGADCIYFRLCGNFSLFTAAFDNIVQLII